MKTRLDSLRLAERCFDRAVYEVGRNDKALAQFFFNAASGYLQKSKREIQDYVERTNK